MKSRIFTAFVVFVSLALVLTGAVAAQGPEPPPQQRITPPVPPGLAWDWRSELPFPRPAPLAGLDARNSSAPTVDLGQPGLSFRYVRTFGETLVPYLADNDHLFRPWGVAVDASDNVYVTERYGHRMMKFTSDSSFVTSIGQAGVWLANTTNRIAEPRHLAIDPSGNIWIVERWANRVSQWSPAGAYMGQLGRTFSSGSDNDRFQSPQGIAFDRTGNVYVSDTNNHRVQIFSLAGTYSATIGATGTCGSTNERFCSPQGLAFDQVGRLYVADTNNHRVQVFDANWNYLATIGTTSTCGQGNAQLCFPADVEIGPDGKVYVADTDNSRVQIFAAYPSLAYEATLGVTGQWGSDNNHFSDPTGVAVDHHGNVYVADESNARVQMFNSNRAYVRTFGMTGVPYITDGQHFEAPDDVTVDALGNLIVVEGLGQRVVKLDADGMTVFTIGSPGNSGGGTDRFCWPSGIATDSARRTYVADNCNSRVQVYDSSGLYLNTLGTGWGTGNYQFRGSTGIAIGPNDYIYVVDAGNHRIQVYDSHHGYVTTLGETGVAGSDNGHFNGPQSVALDQAGNIYVADVNNLRVQKCNLSGVCTTFAGVTGQGGGDFGHFSEPDDVAVDKHDRVYVVDQHNRRIQVFDQNGAYLTTIGGSSGQGNGQNQNPLGVDVDTAGNVYIVDLSNHRIQKFAPGVPGWVQTNINGFGDRGNWWVGTLTGFGGDLYAGTYNDNGAEVWRMNSDWALSSAGGFGVNENIGIDHLAGFNGYLYAGTDNYVTGAEVWRSSDSLSWTRVVSQGFGNPSTNSEIGYLEVFSNTLYASAGTWGSSSSRGVQVWRTLDGLSWTNVITSGFGDPANAQIFALKEWDDYFYAGTLNRDTGGELWRSRTGDAGSWAQVNVDGFGNADNDAVTTLAAFDGYLYAGTRNWYTGAEVWRSSDGITWSQVIGSGFGEGRATGWVDSLTVFDGALYAVTRNYITGVKVWRTTDGAYWMQITPDGFGDSNNGRTGDGDTAVTVFNNRLYIGTWNWANGGEVWKKTVTADFIASPTSGPPPLTVSFANTSAGDYTSSLWDFGDGATSTEISPTHVYTAVGAYTVTLSVGDGVDTSTITRTNYIQVLYHIYLPVLIRTEDPLLYDNFNDPAFDGSYNPALWLFSGEDFFQAQQHNGALVFTNSTAPAAGGVVLTMQQPAQRSLQQLREFEARLKVDSDHTGGYTFVMIQISGDVAGHGWWTQCRLGAFSGGAEPQFVCDVATHAGGGVDFEYTTSAVTVDYDTWHTARIEVDSGTANLRFYLDGMLVGSYTPQDAISLISANSLRPKVGVWNASVDTYATRYVDNVRITPVGR